MKPINQQEATHVVKSREAARWLSLSFKVARRFQCFRDLWLQPPSVAGYEPRLPGSNYKCQQLYPELAMQMPHGSINSKYSRIRPKNEFATYCMLWIAYLQIGVSWACLFGYYQRGAHRLDWPQPLQHTESSKFNMFETVCLSIFLSS